MAVVGQLADETVTNHLVNWLSPMTERVTIVTGERGCYIADTLTADLTFHANASVPTEWDRISTFRGVSDGDMIRLRSQNRSPCSANMRPSVCVASRPTAPALGANYRIPTRGVGGQAHVPHLDQRTRA